MSNDFTNDSDSDDGQDAPETPPSYKNYMTPTGCSALQQELQQLKYTERPKIVEVVSWAAGNGDRSENGDYLYGKKRLREIDRRIRYLTKQLESAEIVDPARQQGLDRVFFGATVTYALPDDSEHQVKLVGMDEADMAQGKISWISPVATALMKSQVGDVKEVKTPAGLQTIEVVAIHYDSK